MMLNLSSAWLADKAFRTTLEQSGPLGIGILDKLEHVHKPLAEIGAKRSAAKSGVTKLTRLIASLDGRHDSKARALFNHLGALAEGSDDPERKSFYLELQRQLFPQGLRVIRKPYIEEAGAAVAMFETVDAKTRAALASITVGEQTLDDLFVAWMAAGVELGKAVKRRAELRASLSREGSAVNEVSIVAARGDWTNVARGLLWVINTEPALAGLDEPVRAAIGQAIDVALGRHDGGAGSGAGESEAGESEDGGDEDGEPDDEDGEPDDENGEPDDENSEPDTSS